MPIGLLSIVLNPLGSAIAWWISQGHSWIYSPHRNRRNPYKALRGTAVVPLTRCARVPKFLLNKGSGSPIGWATHRNPEKPGWAALLDHQPNQFAVIDNRTVITGSCNWSPTAAHQNDEVLLVIESPLLAAHFTREMDRLWQGAELGINGRLARKLAANRRRCGSGVRREVAGG